MQLGAAMKSVRTTVSLPKNQYEQLQALADANGLSVAWVVRQAVGDFLESVSKNKKFTPLKNSLKEPRT